MPTVSTQTQYKYTGTRSVRRRGKRPKSRKFRSVYALFKSLRTPIPYSVVRKMAWSTTDTINGAVGLLGVNRTYSANGMYDPSLGGGTPEQPVGFDQYVGTLYDHYVVLGAKITVTFFNEGTTPVTCGVMTRDRSTPVIDNLRNFRESSSTVAYLTPAGGSKDRITLTRFVDIGKFMHTDVDKITALSGSVTANPLEGVFFHIIMGSVNPADDPADNPIIVKIEYVALLREPIIQPLS